VTVLLVSEYGADIDKWRRCLGACVPAQAVRVWNEPGDPAEIDIILTDTRFSPTRSYREFANLKWVHFLGHGAGDVLLDPTLPPDVIVTRLVDGDIVNGLTEYVVQAVTTVHLRVAEFAGLQRKAIWKRLEIPPARDRSVAVLGLGAIGKQIATVLRDIGFKVSGWSQSAKSIAGIRCLEGDDALPGLLGESDFVVCVLPETAKTRGLFDARRLSEMKTGAYLINVGRGSLIVTEALMAALDAGKLSGACLDVFEEEPLPSESPLWSHPSIRATPHTGGAGGDVHQYAAMAENCRRFSAGEPLLNIAHRGKGY
jgi:glyoxylate/hydroxypyruvate reductase A